MTPTVGAQLVRLGEVRIDSYGLVVVSDGFLVPAELSLGKAPIVVSHDIVRIAPDRLGVVSDGFLVFSLRRSNLQGINC